jgi:hypothetical protein
MSRIWAVWNATLCSNPGPRICRPFAYRSSMVCWISKHGESPDATSPRDLSMPPAPADSAQEKMNSKMKTEAGRVLYKMRKAIVEAVFGQIEAARVSELSGYAESRKLARMCVAQIRFHQTLRSPERSFVHRFVNSGPGRSQTKSRSIVLRCV